jgi:CheY-like chemotaxis protein
MGGEIAVSSKLGEGSCFRFYIQAGLAPAIPTTNSFTPDDVVSIVPGQKYRILIVEDNGTNRLLLSKILKDIGLEVQEAENGQIAIALCQQWHPHLIFMDMQMPILDGYAATRQIRLWEQEREQELAPGQISHTTKIIALTASAFAEQREDSLAAGCDDFVSKPFRREEILATLSHHLQIKYLHKPTATNQITPNSLEHQPEFILDTHALDIMPDEWIAQLYFAAAQGNDTRCLHLIEQIPPEHTLLIAALNILIETYQFDHLMQLTQPK